MRKNSFKNFHDIFIYKKPQELLEQFGVFEGFSDLELLHDKISLFENIMIHVLKKYDELKDLFIFSDDKDEQKIMETLLYKIATGDRKSFSILKKAQISQIKGRAIYKKLIQKSIILKEYSREQPLKKEPKQLIKKEFRGYMIEDKIQFFKQFYRFWFTFIYPNQELLQNKKYEEVLKIIKSNFDKYISLTFEFLCNDFIQEYFLHDQIVQIGSYWDKDIEIDLLAKTKSGKLIAGECKYKNQKICKNTLTKLQKKCKKANLDINTYALFSKSGFSKELQKLKSTNLLLFDLNQQFLNIKSQ